jgi:hypothetical protein
MYDNMMGVLLAVTCVVVIAGGFTYLSKNIPAIPTNLISSLK